MIDLHVQAKHGWVALSPRTGLLPHENLMISDLSFLAGVTDWPLTSNMRTRVSTFAAMVEAL